MKTLNEIRNVNGKKYSPFDSVDTKIISLTEDELEKERQQYEDFVKPISQKVFARQLIKENI